MKKFLLSLFFAAILSNAYSESINIVQAPNITQRVSPTQENSILSYHDSVANAKKSVVNIATTSTVTVNNRQFDFMLNDPFFRDFFKNSPFSQPQKHQSTSLGSGVIISSNGYIVTNNHVVNGADEIVVTLSDSDKEYKAKIIGLDPKTDLAVIKIEEKNLQAITFANSDNLQEGDVVFALGNPFGIGSTITQGIISALGKNGVMPNQYENFIQTDASINPGNSGGALIDSRGALIGINSAILSRSGDNNGIGFAIPSNTVKKIALPLIADGKIERGYLGVSIGDLTSDLKDIYTNKEGALIMGVEEGSAADKAKLKRGDLIIKIDDKSIKNTNELKNTIGDKNPNAKISITYERSNKLYTTTVKLDKLDSDTAAKGTSGGDEIIGGLTLENVTDPSKYNLPKNTKGVLVTKVVENSTGAKAGFRTGDIILQVGENTINSIDDLQVAINKMPKGKKPVYISRSGLVIVLVMQ
ncbi:MAG: Do family serine endopeptidase [Campylobacteraceae bacterium]|jgi:serine protease Do|nr:Do family serine endopeptidase [Campylobacteraceae bacterium]